MEFSKTLDEIFDFVQRESKAMTDYAEYLNTEQARRDARMYSLGLRRVVTYAAGKMWKE
jgi:hypothetical protein